ncbi:MAG TPA: DUF6057 family protein [Prolixibacteraceae bacterium]|nr:DUF6057 family protein [Prolixibacteraceae bacterium]
MELNNKNLTNLLLVIGSLYAWWFTASAINPQLHYYLQQSAFLTDFSFFKGFARYPGGIADYISQFISQFFHYKIAGSLLIVLTAVGLGMIAIRLVERIAGKIKLSFSVIAIYLWLSILIQCNYYYPFYASVRLLMAVSFILMFDWASSKFPQWRYPAALILAILLFYCAGGAALFIFALSMIILQIHNSGKKADWLYLPLFALFSGLLPYLSYKYVFLVNLPLVYDLTHSKSPEIIFYAPDYKLYALYALLPSLLFIAMLYNRLKLRMEKAPTVSNTKKQDIHKKGLKKQDNRTVSTEHTSKVKTSASPVLWVAGQFLIMALLAVFTLNATLDKTLRNKLLVSYYASNEDWEKVLQSVKAVEGYDLFVNVDFNRALANQGKLADNLFSYAQLAGPSGLFIDGKVTSDIPFICCDQYYDLGFMHEAQHWAFEAQTIFPNSPRLLKRLVQINLVMGDYALAKKFLNQLDHNMLFHQWVDHYQKYIDDTTLVSKDPELAFKRKCEPSESFTAGDATVKLTKLVEANPGNRMAMDYLLCSILLEGDLASFKSLIAKNNHLYGSSLPRAFDEALVLYYYISRQDPVPGEIKYSVERQKQFTTFVNAIKPFGSDWQSARQTLARAFGNTYWYYLKCQSPNVTKAQIKRK